MKTLAQAFQENPLLTTSILVIVDDMMFALHKQGVSPENAKKIIESKQEEIIKREDFNQ